MRQSFLVDISHQQNATWQGTVTWIDKNMTQSFRSALELIRLIDSTMTGEPCSERKINTGQDSMPE